MSELPTASETTPALLSDVCPFYRICVMRLLTCVPSIAYVSCEFYSYIAVLYSATVVCYIHKNKAQSKLIKINRCVAKSYEFYRRECCQYKPNFVQVTRQPLLSLLSVYYCFQRILTTITRDPHTTKELSAKMLVLAKTPEWNY